MPLQNQEFERRVLSKVVRRLVPFIFLCYVIAYIDRVNIGFAAPFMQKDLAMSNAVYGFGAGLFFLGYFLFEIPSNLILERVGARIWIARIMIVWGVVSMAMMFVLGKWSFYGMRVLLGLAEAGFFPGMILYLTYWIPARERARDRRAVHAGHPDGHAGGRAGVRGAAGPGGRGGPARLAVAVPDGGAAGGGAGDRRSVRSDRPPRKGRLASGAGTRVAEPRRWSASGPSASPATPRPGRRCGTPGC